MDELPLPDPRTLVPLNTLQSSLYRQLYPRPHFPMSLPSPSTDSRSPLPPSPQEKPSEPESSTPPESKASATPAASDDNSPAHPCQWVDCDKLLPDPESLYNHLCNDHIGRKSTGNLCLTCKWKDCGTTCAKRDHITSHLRVHTPLKPHICEICKKSFKRPQDLKKHEKIHTEEHHAQHKHSKAITVADPNYVSRVRGDSTRALSQPKSKQPLNSSVSAERISVPLARAKSDSVSLSESSSDFGVLPTPSPDIAHSPIHYNAADHNPHELYGMQNQLPSWEVLRSDGSSTSITPGTTGAKRSYDYGMGEFFTDVKKRRVNPSYDSHMAERLNTLQHSQSLSNATGRRVTVGPPSHPPSSFSPRSVSFDIRSAEELAAVNEFLITLGRDVSGPPPSNSNSGRHSHPGSIPADDFAATQNYFDSASLSQLGLVGMPGVPSAPGSGAGYHGDAGYSSSSNIMGPQVPNAYPSRASHQSVQPIQYGIYPSMPNLGPSHYGSSEYPSQHSRRLSLSPPGSEDAQYPSHFSAPFHQPTPSHYLPRPQENISIGGASPLSSHSAMSTPPITTPPHSYALPDGVASFDCIGTKRGPPPTIALAPVDISQRNMRTIVRLQNARGSESLTSGRPEPMEPKLSSGSVHRGPPAKLTPHTISSLSGSASSSTSSRTNDRLYPFLTSGDADLKLAPIHHRYRSPSPKSPSSLLSRASTISPSPYDDEEEAEDTSDHRMHSLVSSGSSTPSPPPRLPGFQAVASQNAPRALTSSKFGEVRYPDTEERLAGEVGRIALETRRSPPLSHQQRMEHARLLRDLLVNINTEYRKRFGTPPPVSRPTVSADLERGIEKHREETRDVEMLTV
ncbi:hypothetical protein ABKN59_002774 [Abortiporus biennis]